MNQQDMKALTERWHSQTNSLNDSVDAAFKDAQNHAYELGRARGRLDAQARHEPRESLGVKRFDAIAESMPGGTAGFMKQWGWRDYALALEAAHQIGSTGK